MKKYFCIFLIIAIAHAKEMNYNINFFAGINRSGLNIKNSGSNFGPYDEIKQAGNVGGSLEICFSNKISGEIGLQYINSGGSTKRMIGTDEFGNELGKFYLSREMKYLEMPLALNYKWDKRTFIPYVSGGLTLGALLNAEEKIKYNYQKNENLGEIKKAMNSYNLNLDVGGGILFPISENISIRLMLRKSFGVTNQLKNGDSKHYQKNENFSVMLGTSINI